MSNLFCQHITSELSVYRFSIELFVGHTVSLLRVPSLILTLATRALVIASELYTSAAAWSFDKPAISISDMALPGPKWLRTNVTLRVGYQTIAAMGWQ